MRRHLRNRPSAGLSENGRRKGGRAVRRRARARAPVPAGLPGRAHLHGLSRDDRPGGHRRGGHLHAQRSSFAHRLRRADGGEARLQRKAGLHLGGGCAGHAAGRASERKDADGHAQQPLCARLAVCPPVHSGGQCRRNLRCPLRVAAPPGHSGNGRLVHHEGALPAAAR